MSSQQLPIGTALAFTGAAPGFGTAAGTIAASIPGAEYMPGFDLAKKVFGIGGNPGTGGTLGAIFDYFVQPETIARIVTGLLGLLLIAAAIFTHPTVINVGKKVTKAAAKAGEVAAAA